MIYLDVNCYRPKQLIETDDEDSQEGTDEMDIPTTVTIVEEDGSTSVVEDASVSSIVTDAGPNSSIQFGQSSGGTRIIGMGWGESLDVENS
jgi:hypothetical protein